MANVNATQLLFRVLALGAVLSFGQGAGAADIDARVSANILGKVAVTATRELTFSGISIEGGTHPITLSVSSDDIRSCGTAAVCGGSFAAARFILAGQAKESFAVSLPVLQEVETGAGRVVLDGFSVSQGGIGALNGQGKAVLRVGARIRLTPGLTEGSFSGSFPVVVDHN